ncbi:hypothetical protein COCNU_scaffold004346G000010 [Cocos nucifera]|nr:hypothetical protein [Cocos nucifera]
MTPKEQNRLTYGIKTLKRKDGRGEELSKRAKLGYYLYAHSEVANLRKAEASRAIEEAQAKIKKVQVKVEGLSEASRSHFVEVEHLQEVLRREKQVSAGLKTTLALEDDKWRKIEE